MRLSHDHMSADMVDIPPRPWPTGTAERPEPLVTRVLAPNPSPYTFTGTQTYLVGAGEMNVGALADAVGLSQSALSQHLARLREEGLVATRREAQTIHYRLADPKAARLLALLRDIYCPPDATTCS